MPQTKQNRPNRRKAAVTLPIVTERRVSTPNPNLVVVKIGDQHRQLPLLEVERSGRIIGKIAKAMSKPGTDRNRVFQSSLSVPVFACFADGEDPAKIVREDVLGRRVVGRLVNGRFRPFPVSKVR